MSELNWLENEKEKFVEKGFYFRSRIFIELDKKIALHVTKNHVLVNILMYFFGDYIICPGCPSMSRTLQNLVPHHCSYRPY